MRKAQPLRARLRQLTVEAILDAAEETFADLGLGAGMDAIASRAGVAVGTLYNHFDDRQALLDALGAARRAEVVAALGGALDATAGQPFRARLLAALTGILQAVGRHTRFRRQLLEHAPPGAKVKREIKARLAPRLEELLAQGRAERALASDPHGLQLTILMGLVHAFVTLATEEPDRLAIADAPAHICDAFLHGVGVK